MKRKITYISELGYSYDTAEKAAEDDKRLPNLITIYKRDLTLMEGGIELFGGSPVTEKLKQQWRDAIADYERKWEAAQVSSTASDQAAGSEIVMGLCEVPHIMLRQGSLYRFVVTPGCPKRIEAAAPYQESGEAGDFTVNQRIRETILAVVDKSNGAFWGDFYDALIPTYKVDDARQVLRTLVNHGVLRMREDDQEHDWEYVRGSNWPAETLPT